MQIVSADQASAEGWEAKRITLDFGSGQDGTALVERFLRDAARRGALAVSDIHIELITTRDRQPLRCVTAVSLESESRTRTESVYRSSRHTGRYVMKPVTRTVTESRQECRYVSKPVTKTETTYESSYDYSSKSYRTRPRTRTVTRYESRYECNYRPVTRMVTRYEYQYESEYIPPRWETISRRYTEHKLVEARPECVPIEPRGPRSHRIVGTAYYHSDKRCKRARRAMASAESDSKRLAIARSMPASCHRSSKPPSDRTRGIDDDR